MTTSDMKKEADAGLWPKLTSDLLDERRSPGMTTLQTRRVATLERQAPLTIDIAKRAGVDIEYLGVGPLFADVRAYSGLGTDWIFGPAGEHEAFVVPASQKRDLERLAKASLRFPLVYIAHETPKGSVVPYEAEPGTLLAEIEPARAAEVIPAVPPPQEAVETGRRLDEHSRRILAGLRGVLVGVGAVAASPFVLAGAALSSLATLDPIVIGAIPALSTRVGDPAAFYVLARWDW